MAAGARILVAEDNEDLQKLVKRAFEREGYVVVPALTAAQMVAEIAQEKPDLIVLDVGLPDGDGRDLLAMLKKAPRTRSIPVVIWSGRDAESDRRIALDLGAEDYVEKGRTSELVRKIERLLLRLRMQA
jgi:two-component system, OmpR family, KDP operon response regulator KdpE